ncbi:aldehyde ferredoxin oxidoreductase N-terminal domain-containing protein, partial [Chloroflexota bacterium]
MPGGYTGKILFVDLTSGEIREETPDEKLLRDFIGGYGIGARVLYSRQKGGVDPLGPDNILGLVTGPLTGSTNCWGARYTAVAKSPLTGVWGDSNCGGEFGPYLKFAGYDAVYFTGASAKPVYLLCNNGKAEFRDASFLWGKDTYETIELLKPELGNNFRAATIGPSGEKKALLASIISERFRAAARAGLGAVMGSKNLKAVVVMGNQTIPIADKEGLSKISKKYLAYIKTNPIGINWGKFGTCGITASAVTSGDAAIKNWTLAGLENFPNAEDISGQSVIDIQSVRHGCWR